MKITTKSFIVHHLLSLLLSLFYYKKNCGKDKVQYKCRLHDKVLVSPTRIKADDAKVLSSPLKYKIAI